MDPQGLKTFTVEKPQKFKRTEVKVEGDVTITTERKLLADRGVIVSWTIDPAGGENDGPGVIWIELAFGKGDKSGGIEPGTLGRRARVKLTANEDGFDPAPFLALFKKQHLDRLAWEKELQDEREFPQGTIE